MLDIETYETPDMLELGEAAELLDVSERVLDQQRES
jgi:hypothetical protein